MELVVVIGPKRAGKDSVYELMKKNKSAHGKLSFAKPLKEICSRVFNIPIQLFNDPDLKDKELKVPFKLTAKHINRVKGEMVQLLDPIEYRYNAHVAPIQGLTGHIMTTPRKIMQIIGTNFIRNRVMKQWHVKTALSDSYLASQKLVRSGRYVVTDCRFKNEYEELKARGAKFYYVERPEAEERLEESEEESELEVPELKKLVEAEGKIIKNDGSLDDLEKLVKKEFKRAKKNGKSKSKQ